jgi:hypothetical protein
MIGSRVENVDTQNSKGMTSQFSDLGDFYA